MMGHKGAFGHGEFSNQNRSSVREPFDHGGVVVRDPACQERHPGRRRHLLRKVEVFESNRDPFERPPGLPLRQRRFGLLGGRQGPMGINHCESMKLGVQPFNAL